MVTRQNNEELTRLFEQIWAAVYTAVESGATNDEINAIVNEALIEAEGAAKRTAEAARILAGLPQRQDQHQAM